MAGVLARYPFTLRAFLKSSWSPHDNTLRENCTTVGSFCVVDHTSTACLRANFKIDSSQGKFLWARIISLSCLCLCLSLCRKKQAAHAKPVKTTLYSGLPINKGLSLLHVTPSVHCIPQPSWHRRGSTNAGLDSEGPRWGSARGRASAGRRSCGIWLQLCC